MSSIDRAALVSVTAWRRTGDKPLPEPMMTQSTDAYMRYLGEMIEPSFRYNDIPDDMIWYVA